MERLPLVHPDDSIANQFDWRPRYDNVASLRSGTAQSSHSRRVSTAPTTDDYGRKTVAEWATELLKHVTEFAQHNPLTMDNVNRLFSLEFFVPPPSSAVPEDLVTVLLPGSDYMSVPITNTPILELAKDIDAIVSRLDAQQTQNGTALYNSVFKMLSSLNPRIFKDNRKQTMVMHYVFTHEEMLSALATISDHAPPGTPSASSHHQEATPSSPGRSGKPRSAFADLDLYQPQPSSSQEISQAPAPRPHSPSSHTTPPQVATPTPTSRPAKKHRSNASLQRYPRPPESTITSALIASLSEDPADVATHSQIIASAPLTKHLRVDDVYPALHEWLAPLSFAHRAIRVFSLKGATRCLSCSHPVTITPDSVPGHNCLTTRFLATFRDTAWCRSGLREYHPSHRLWTRLVAKSPAATAYGLTRLQHPTTKEFNPHYLIEVSLPTTQAPEAEYSQRIKRSSDSQSDESDIDVTGYVSIDPDST